MRARPWLPATEHDVGHRTYSFWQRDCLDTGRIERFADVGNYA
jgi:hypothetical protein